MAGPLERSLPGNAPDGAALQRIPNVFHSETLAGNLTLDAKYPAICKFDAGGSNRDITLDAEPGNAGLYRRILNGSDAAENLVVKDDATSPNTIATINQNEEAEFYCDGSSWSLICVRTIALS